MKAMAFRKASVRIERTFILWNSAQVIWARVDSYYMRKELNKLQIGILQDMRAGRSLIGPMIQYNSPEEHSVKAAAEDLRAMGLLQSDNKISEEGKEILKNLGY